MNSKSSLVLAFTYLLFSCGNPKEKSEFDTTIESFSALKNIANEAEKMEDQQNKLLEATPLSNDALKAILPEFLLNIKRTSFSVGNPIMKSIAVARATYKNDKSSIKLTIMDGAGETGSAIIGVSRLSLATDFQEENEKGYRKSINLNGSKALEESRKDNYNNINNKLTTLINDRFLITLNAKNISIEKLKEAFSELNLSSLKKI